MTNTSQTHSHAHRTQPQQPSTEQRVTSWIAVVLFIITASLIIQNTYFRFHPIALYVLGFAVARALKFSYRELLVYAVVTTGLLFFVPVSYSVRLLEAPLYGVSLLILCYVSGETYRMSTQLAALEQMIHRERKHNG